MQGGGTATEEKHCCLMGFNTDRQLMAGGQHQAQFRKHKPHYELFTQPTRAQREMQSGILQMQEGGEMGTFERD